MKRASFELSFLFNFKQYASNKPSPSKYKKMNKAAIILSLLSRKFSPPIHITKSTD